jgi:two-component system invasion response regulator UvrY
MSSCYRFAIADDHNYWRQVLMDLVRQHFPDSRIVHEARTGTQVVKFISNAPTEDIPDLVILDLNMPDLNGFETSKWLYTNRPAIKIVTLSLIQDELIAIRLLNYGVRGLLQKNIEGTELVTAITDVMQGEMYLSIFTDDSNHPFRPNTYTPGKIKNVLQIWSTLSKQEKQVFQLCCSDLPYSKIAREMRLANIRDVQRIAAGLFESFEVGNRIELFLLAHKNNLTKLMATELLK